MASSLQLCVVFSPVVPSGPWLASSSLVPSGPRAAGAWCLQGPERQQFLLARLLVSAADLIVASNPS